MGKNEVENPDNYEEYIEKTQEAQEQFIKKRGPSFVFYHSFIEALEDMNDIDFRACILALTDYALYGKESEYKGIVKMYMTQARPQIDANLKKRINGLKGGPPLGNDNARKQPKTT
jgi:hypothetical protein